jgi:hypothetical protein
MYDNHHVLSILRYIGPAIIHIGRGYNVNPNIIRLLSNLGAYRLLVSLIEQDISLYRIPFVLSKQAESS